MPDDAFEAWFKTSSLAGYMKKEDARKVWRAAVTTITSEAIDLLDEFAEHGLTSTRVKRARSIVAATRRDEGDYRDA